MSENGLHKIPAMRAAFVAIQELHKPQLVEDFFNDIKGSSANRWMRVCASCDFDAYPCPTRKLADEGLGAGNEPEV